MIARLRHRLHREGGFTLVEVIVAMFLLTFGALATLGVLGSSQRLQLSSQRVQKASEDAEIIIERATALGMADWGSLVSGQGTSAPPAQVSARLTPSGCAAAVPQTCTSLAIDQTPGDSDPGTAFESLVTATCATADEWKKCVPATTAVTGGTAYVYVTTASGQALTVGSKTYTPKRITVAVQLTADARKTVAAPTWLSTVVTPPEVTP